MFSICSGNTGEAQTLGRWDRDHYHMSYDTILPIGILLVQGGYRDNKDAYVLPRSRHQPPAHILKRLWPWADAALAEVTRVSCQIVGIAKKLQSFRFWLTFFIITFWLLHFIIRCEEERRMGLSQWHRG